MVLRDGHLAVFLGDSPASSIPMHRIQYGVVPFLAAAAGQIDGKVSGTADSRSLRE